MARMKGRVLAADVADEEKSFGEDGADYGFLNNLSLLEDKINADRLEACPTFEETSFDATKNRPGERPVFLLRCNATDVLFLAFGSQLRV